MFRLQGQPSAKQCQQSCGCSFLYMLACCCLWALKLLGQLRHDHFTKCESSQTSSLVKGEQQPSAPSRTPARCVRRGPPRHCTHENLISSHLESDLAQSSTDLYTSCPEYTMQASCTHQLRDFVTVQARAHRRCQSQHRSTARAPRAAPIVTAASFPSSLDRSPATPAEIAAKGKPLTIAITGATGYLGKRARGMQHPPVCASTTLQQLAHRLQAAASRSACSPKATQCTQWWPPMSLRTQPRQPT